MSVDIVGENIKAGTYNYEQVKTNPLEGDLSVAGFAREISVNVGETVHFSVDGGATEIWIFRVGWYGGVGFRRVTTIPNTPTVQNNGVEVAGTSGATTQTSWSTTAQWQVPADAVSGMYMAMVRNVAGNNAFNIAFIVRDDDAEADIIYKTSDTTWNAAYNHYGLKSAPYAGKNVYGQATGVGQIQQRSTMVSYHRPVITRGTVVQTYWQACELPLIRFLERNGLKVKYISSVDLDKKGMGILQKGKIFLGSGHDEYWTQPMRTAVESFRDNGGKCVFMSGNDIFWRARFEYVGDEVRMHCYKDTMPGPGTHVAGQPLDPVTWTGTWRDTRWANRNPEYFLLGTEFGMNGVYDYDAVVPRNPYGNHKVWGGSSLVDSDITLKQVIGFEADHIKPSRPAKNVRILASYLRSAPGGISDANGQFYDVQGSIEWGIVAQGHPGGGVTVGFGTCQWSWVLDGAHDRGSGETAVSLDAQKFTINLFRDLGADPASLMAGITLQPKNELTEYGVTTGEEVPEEPTDPTEPPTGPITSRWMTYDGKSLVPYALINGVLVRTI